MWRRARACHDPLPVSEPAATLARPRTSSVIVIAIDGARWQEMFNGVDPTRTSVPELIGRDARGLLPHIYGRMVDGGLAIGAPGRGRPMLASGPAYLSLPGYQELLTGQPATACRSNRCPFVGLPTLLDRVRVAFSLPPEQVAAIASWERMERATSTDNHKIVVSAGRHHGATRDALRVSPCASATLDQAAASSAAPGHDDYRADRYTASLALEYLRARRPRVLFVGLGDTDEYGHGGDYRWYLDALGQLDLFVGQLFATLDGMGEYGAQTTVVLTTDHGWSEDFAAHGGDEPASARVWLFAAGGAIPRRGLVEAARTYHLADVTPSLLALLGIELSPEERSSLIPELVPAAAPAVVAP